MNTALDNVLENAKAAAATRAVVAEPMMGTALTHVAPAGGLAKPGQNFTDSGGIDVDMYLKTDREGFKLGDEFKGLIDSFEGEIDLSEVVYIYSVRAEQPGSGGISYIKSYDGVSTTEGKNFLAEAHRYETTMLKSTGIYETMEIPITLTEDVKDPKSTFVAKADTTVGTTPPPSGIKGFRRLLKQVKAQGGDDKMSVVKVRFTHEQKVNTNKQAYGVISYELLEVN